MAEYTYKDIIIDPTSEEAKNAIGKKCYMYDSPTMLLKMANSDDGARTLESIDESDYPFNDKEFGSEWTCIIVKKEEPKSQYVPFESAEEFISAYYSRNTKIPFPPEYKYFRFGIWIKCNVSNATYLMTGIDEKGILMSNSYASWEELVLNFEFLDGAPCGKLEVKDE